MRQNQRHCCVAKTCFKILKIQRKNGVERTQRPPPQAVRLNGTRPFNSRRIGAHRDRRHRQYDAQTCLNRSNV